MEIFLVIDGQKSGPHSIYQVREKLRSGVATPDTKAWVRGMPNWTPLSEFPPLENDAELRVAGAGADEIAISDEERAIIIDAVSERPRPWPRFWARTLDMVLFTTFVTALVKVTGLADPALVAYPTGNNLGILLAVPAAWIFVEATLLLYFRTTPGKWLFNIKLQRQDGEPIGLGLALRRSLSVWWRGWGCGLFPLQLLACALSHMALTATGATAWDRACELEIKQERVGELRIAAAVALMLAAGYVIITVAGPPPPILPAK